jgi:protein SCO1
MLALAAPLIGLLPSVDSAAVAHEHEHVPSPRRKWAKTPSRQILQERFFPNIPLTSHTGQKVRFYQDLLKDKIVMINMMYTTCEGICPGVTSNLVKVQKLLGRKLGRDVFMYSISLKPEEDTPDALQKYVTAHKVMPGWTFYTGARADTERLRVSLGYVDPDPKVDADKQQHTGMIVYGNEKRELWAACPATGDPEWIVESVGFVMTS